MKNFLLKKISKYYFLSKIAAEARNPRNIFQAMEWLGIEPSDSLTSDLIRKKYKKIVFENHPDKTDDKEASGIKLIEADNAKKMLESYLESREKREEYAPPPRRESPFSREEDPFADMDRERRASRERERAEKEREERVERERAERIERERAERAERERAERIEKGRSESARRKETVNFDEPYARVGIGQIVWLLDQPGKLPRFLGLVTGINHVRNTVTVKYPITDDFGEIQSIEEHSANMNKIVPFTEGEKVMFRRTSGVFEFAKAYSQPFKKYGLKLIWENENKRTLTKDLSFDKVFKV